MSGSTVDEIKDKVNIVDEIGKVVRLKRAGSSYKGLCPFHSEKTPSFVVSEDKQIFTCFGCNASGDVISFVQRYYNLEFPEALRRLCEENGIEYKDSRGRNSGKNEELYELNRMAARYFLERISTGDNPGLRYMTGRGISVDTIKKFGIGYAPDSWDGLLKYMEAGGADRDKLVSLGLLSRKQDRYYDKFRNRVIFPIINARGKVIGFGGRALSPEAAPKYLNSPESSVFSKKNNLYGINLSRKEIIKEDRVILVEGYMDVISLYQAGVKNVCASLGTALTSNQSRLISKYTKNVILSYDSDAAGRNAALRGIDILRTEGLTSKVAHVTEGKDPDEFIKARGRLAYLELAEAGTPDIQYIIDDIRGKYNLDETMDRLSFIKAVVPVLSGLGPAEQDIYIKKIAADTDISEAALIRELREAAGDEAPERKRTRAEKARSAGESMSKAEKELIRLAVTEEQYLEEVKKNRDLFYSPAAIELLDTIIAGQDSGEPLSRSADDDIHGLLGDISAGAGPDPDSTLKSCLRSLEIGRLNRRYREITSIIDLTEDREKSEALLREQMDIQKRINGLKRR